MLAWLYDIKPDSNGIRFVLFGFLDGASSEIWKHQVGDGNRKSFLGDVECLQL